MGSTVIPMNLGADSYDIILERGVLRRAGEILNLRRKVMIVSDSGVPGKWTQALADQCEKAEVFRIPAGEENKNLDSFRDVMRRMLAWIPPVISNMAIIPIVLQQVYGVADAWWYLVLTVGAGEVISCGLLGVLLYRAAVKIPQLR